MRRLILSTVLCAAAVASGAVSPPAATPRLDCRPHSFPQRTQQSLAVHPTNDRILYVGVEQEGFFKSVDGGATWARASTGIKAWPRTDGSGRPCYEEFYATVIDPRRPSRLCIAMAGSPGTTGVTSSAANNGVYCSIDGAKTWQQRVGPGMNTAVYSLAADERNFDVMYAGVNGGPCSTPPPACAPGTYFNTRGAIYKTTSGGRRWTELDALYTQDLRVTSVRASRNTIVASTFSKLSTGGPGNFETKQLGVLRSTDGGATWTASTQGMSADPREQALLGLDMAPRNPQRVFVTASSSRSYWSADGGVTFHATERAAAVAFDPHDPAGLHLLACMGDAIKESRDGGRTWTTIAKTPGFVSIQKGVPTRIAWSLKSPRTVFLAGPYASVHRSTDGGVTWTQILSGDRLPTA